MAYYERFSIPSNIQPNNIENLFEKSVESFTQTGMYELADKWQTILNNYRNARYNRQY
jgi:hypothetical protein